MHTHTHKSGEDKKGFTLLFSILVSILVLAVGASIISIALKQVILSGAGRESQYAFYAANTGIECALYWDLHGLEVVDGTLHYVFAPPGETVRADIAEPGIAECAGGNIFNGNGFTDPAPKFTGGWSTPTSGVTTFTMAITNDINDETRGLMYCARVTVEKAVEGEQTVTTITSRGLNSCNPDADQRAVERGIVLQYAS